MMHKVVLHTFNRAGVLAKSTIGVGEEG